jgi:hypothetical protein
MGLNDADWYWPLPATGTVEVNTGGPAHVASSGP